MARSRLPTSKDLRRGATARAVLSFLLLVTLASGALHHHPAAGPSAGMPGVSTGTHAGQTEPDRALPCLACLYLRGLFMNPSGGASMAPSPTVSIAGRPLPGPVLPFAPVLVRTGPRAPPGPAGR